MRAGEPEPRVAALLPGGAVRIGLLVPVARLGPSGKHGI